MEGSATTSAAMEIDVDAILRRAEHWQKSERAELELWMEIIQSTYDDGQYEFVHSFCSTLLERELPLFHRAKLETFMAIVQPEDSEIDAEERLDNAAYWLLQADIVIRGAGGEDPNVQEWEEKIALLRSQLEVNVETVEYAIESAEATEPSSPVVGIATPAEHFVGGMYESTTDEKPPVSDRGTSGSSAIQVSVTTVGDVRTNAKNEADAKTKEEVGAEKPAEEGREERSKKGIENKPEKESLMPDLSKDMSITVPREAASSDIQVDLALDAPEEEEEPKPEKRKKKSKVELSMQEKMAEKEKKGKTLRGLRNVPPSVRMALANQAFAQGQGSEGVARKLTKKATIDGIQSRFKREGDDGGEK